MTIKYYGKMSIKFFLLCKEEPEPSHKNPVYLVEYELESKKPRVFKDLVTRIWDGEVGSENLVAYIDWSLVNKNGFPDGKDYAVLMLRLFMTNQCKVTMNGKVYLSPHDAKELLEDGKQ